MSDFDCDILFISELGLYPFDQGFKVHGSQMARALAQRGFDVRVSTIEPPPPPPEAETEAEAGAPHWLSELCVDWPASRPLDEARLMTGWTGRWQKLRYRLAEHQGVDPAAFAGAMRLVEQHRPRVVVGLGQHTPMMLRSIQEMFPDTRTIWYAADELVAFQLSCLKREGWRGLRKRLYGVALYAALENAFARGLDGAIGVSPRDAKLLRWIAGPQRVAMVRNGVDLDYYFPSDEQPIEHSLAFWGRMDFEPNIDAMTWFVRRVWPALRAGFRGATLRIVGKNPTPAVRELERYEGVTVTGAVEDVRFEARRASVTVLPMRCGGGIKNKLLEAAAMGLPIVASPTALRGLDMTHPQRTVQVCNHPGEWVETIRRLWQDAALRNELGRRARKWVEREHDWSRAAEELVAFCGDALPRREKHTLTLRRAA